MASRRDFIRTTAATAASLAVARALGSDPAARAAAQIATAPGADPFAIELANAALNAARDAGASYADVRVGRYRSQSISTRERQVAGVSDNASYGLGVRTLINGCWGFAATSTMTRAGAQQAARDAAVLSRAARTVQRHRVEAGRAADRSAGAAWRTHAHGRDEEHRAADRRLRARRPGHALLVHPRARPGTVRQTGLTRDGTFLIENGKITRSLKNFRWNESPLLTLNRLDDLGRPVAVAAGRMMPAVRVARFNFHVALGRSVDVLRGPNRNDESRSLYSTGPRTTSTPREARQSQQRD